MKVQISEQDGIQIASVDSSILQENVSLLRNLMNRLFEDKIYWIVIDLSNANYLSSMAVAVMVDVKIRATQRGGDMNIACANHLIKNLLDITNVSQKIELHTTIQDAVDSLNARRKKKK